MELVQLNLLFLPLLGGYIFYTRCDVTSYQAARCDGHRLIFHAAIFGLGFLILARLIVVTMDRLSPGILAIAEEFALGTALPLALVLAWSIHEISWPKEERDGERVNLKLWLLFTGDIALYAWFIAWLIPRLTSAVVLRSMLIGCLLAVALAGAAHWAERSTRHRNFKISGGSIFVRMTLFASSAALIFLVSIDHIVAFRQWWNDLSPFTGSSASALALALAVVAGLILNLLFPKSFAIEKTHRRFQTNALERLFYNAAVKQELVQISLREGKVYIGWIDWLPPDPRLKDAYMQILPLVSGYRDPITRALNITTRYQQFYAEPNFDPGDFLKVIPVADVWVAALYREEVYTRFQQSDLLEQAPAAASSSNNLERTDPASAEVAAS